MRDAAVLRGIEAFAEAGCLRMANSADSFARRIARRGLRRILARSLWGLAIVSARPLKLP
jgi:hypothetical protein